MLTDEHILTVLFAYQLLFGLKNINELLVPIFIISFSIGFGYGLSHYKIPAQQQAVNFMHHAWRHTPKFVIRLNLFLTNKIE